MQQDLDLAARDDDGWRERDRAQILTDLNQLQAMVLAGILGGSTMPEDAHPLLEKSTAENYHYFTLTMALNYQRDSYTLWRSATATYDDSDTRAVYDPRSVISMSDDEL